MHRRFLSLALVAVGCASSASSATSPVTVQAAGGPSSTGQALVGTGSPEIGAFGFDETGMERSIEPGDDFYTFANGQWAERTEIPPDRADFGQFTVLLDRSQKQVRAILEEAQAQADSKIGRAYRSYLDDSTIEGRGLEPIQPWLKEIDAVRSKQDYAVLVGKAARRFIRGPFHGMVVQDDRRPDEYIYRIHQAGIGLPDRDYYLEDQERLKTIREAYVEHLANMLRLAGETRVESRAKAVLALETEIARVHWTRDDATDATKTYNKMTVESLAESMKGFDLAAYLDVIEANDMREVVVGQPSAIRSIAEILAATDLAVLKDQMLLASLRHYSTVLPEAIDSEQFRFYGSVLQGIPAQKDRWKRAVEYTENVVGELVGQAYAERHFPPEYKAVVTELVDQILAAMERRIDRLTWMQAETKQRAKAKLANFTVKVGYPDKWRDMSALEIEANDAFGNVTRAEAWEFADQMSKLGQPIRKWEWQLSPQTVNAYADFGMMEIVFPAAILQPPFFDPHADPAVNYGGIGAVIGHEISHHFDDQGAKYNETGALEDWWTPADRTAFEAAGKALVAQYDAYEPLPGQFVLGNFTLGENIGDVAGLTIAYDAYRHSLGDQEAALIDGFTGDQRFFLGWAQVWRRNYREAALANRLLVDPHSPAIQRVWVVRNLDAWYDAFNVESGKKLYLSPKERVHIW